MKTLSLQEIEAELARLWEHHTADKRREEKAQKGIEASLKLVREARLAREKAAKEKQRAQRTPLCK